MEREILLTGIGGQSVQLAAAVLAHAAVLEDRHVLMLGTYGGTMRGGPTDSTLVIADEPIASPPIVSESWSALAMHPAYFEAVARKLAPGALVVQNRSLFDGDAQAPPGVHVEQVPATEVAAALGNPLAASLVMVGAYAGLTGLVGVDALVSGMHDCVPSYRRQHLETNEKALRAGFDAVPSVVAAAWPGAGEPA